MTYSVYYYDKRDRVEIPGWYFYDEDGGKIGPYPTEDIARKRCIEYFEEFLSREKL